MFGEEYSRATWVCFGLGIACQGSAIGPISIFSSILLLNIHSATNGEFPIAIKDGVLIMGVAHLCFALFATIPARYIGRKKLLVAGHVFMSASHVIIGVLYVTKQYFAMYAFIIVFISGFHWSTGNITFVYFGEVCTDKAMGIVMGGLFAMNFLMAFTVSFLIDTALGVGGTFWVYGAINFVSIFFCAIFLKETMGKSPAEIKGLYMPKKRV